MEIKLCKKDFIKSEVFFTVLWEIKNNLNKQSKITNYLVIEKLYTNLARNRTRFIEPFLINNNKLI